MAKIVFGMNQSLDGYVDHQEFARWPGAFPSLHRASARPDGECVWPPHIRSHALLGRRPSRVGPGAPRLRAAWRGQPKWVVSRSLKSVGPDATLVEGDLAAAIRGLKARLAGEVQVGGPDLARSLTDLGLIDEYRLYFRPVVLGRGKPFRGPPAAAPPCGERSSWRGRDQADVRSCLSGRMARRIAPTHRGARSHEIRFCRRIGAYCCLVGLNSANTHGAAMKRRRRPKFSPSAPSIPVLTIAGVCRPTGGSSGNCRPLPDGKIEQWYSLQGKPGVAFIINVTDPAILTKCSKSCLWVKHI